MMPKKISRLIPLPMPRSVICSPSHMMKMAPVVSVRIIISRNARPGCCTAPGTCDSMNDAKPYAWKIDSSTVMYRVHCVSFLRPSSPSFCIFSTDGTTAAASWNMMLALM